LLEVPAEHGLSWSLVVGRGDLADHGVSPFSVAARAMNPLQ
jgi:hypothetical protein